MAAFAVSYAVSPSASQDRCLYFSLGCSGDGQLKVGLEAEKFDYNRTTAELGDL